MVADEREYHLKKIQQALGPQDPQRALPPIPAECRRILDVGCGAGQTILASRIPRDCMVVGLDRDLSFLELGRKFSSGVHFVCGNGECLPFCDNFFDFAYARVSLPYMRIRPALAELSRVLQPGAALWITVHPASKAVRRILRGLREFRFRDVVFQSYVLLNGFTLHLFDTEFDFPLKRSRHESFQTKRSIRRALESSEFEQIEARREKSFIVTARKRSRLKPAQSPFAKTPQRVSLPADEHHAMTGT